MESVSLWFFESLGFYIGQLRATVLSDDKLSQGRYAVKIEHALDILKSLKDSDIPILPKSKKAIDPLIAAIQTFSAIGTPDRSANSEEWSPLVDAIDRFHNVLEQEMTDTFTRCITPIGAYST